jgi:hypothetical protein
LYSIHPLSNQRKEKARSSLLKKKNQKERKKKMMNEKKEAELFPPYLTIEGAACMSDPDGV